jgi:hypothetical protein
VQQWQDFLQQQLPQQKLPDLQSLLYKSESAESDFSAYLQFASQWLNKVCVKQLERL